MNYHIIIETNEKVGKTSENKVIYELDKTNLLEIEEDIIIPYLQKKDFQFDGYFLNPSKIVRFVVKESEKTTNEYADYENKHMPSNIIMYISPQDVVQNDKYMVDITKRLFKDVSKKIESISNKPDLTNKSSNIDKSKVFIVHGQDEAVKSDVARFIEKLGIEAIILHEQISAGMTIIEKIEEFSNVGFGVILYTPCDIGFKKDEEDNKQFRARQNVVFEHGYLIAKLGRRNVCALVKGKIEIPNDISGVVYVPLDDHKAWKIDLAKELRNSGYKIDMNMII